MWRRLLERAGDAVPTGKPPPVGAGGEWDGGGMGIDGSWVIIEGSGRDTDPAERAERIERTRPGWGMEDLLHFQDHLDRDHLDEQMGRVAGDPDLLAEEVLPRLIAVSEARYGTDLAAGTPWRGP